MQNKAGLPQHLDRSEATMATYNGYNGLVSYTGYNGDLHMQSLVRYPSIQAAPGATDLMGS